MVNFHVYSSPLPTLKRIFRFFCRAVGALYIFWILISYQKMICIYFLRLCGLTFHSVDSICWYINLKFWCSPINLFLDYFVGFAFGGIAKKLLLNSVSWGFPPSFSSGGFIVHISCFDLAWADICIWCKVGVQLYSFYSFACGYPGFQHQLLKRLSFTHWLVLVFTWKSRDYLHEGLFPGTPPSSSSVCMSVFIPVYTILITVI